MKAKAKLTRGSIAGHLVGQTLPMILGLGAMFSVGVVDAYFIGELGPAPLAAVGFIFPVTAALGSVGVGVMVGINSVMSRALGRGDEEAARRFALVGLAIATAVGSLVGLGLALFQGPLFSLLNVDAELAPLVEAYVVPVAAGFPVILIAQALNGGLRAQGASVRASSVLWVVAITNWILDPLLIRGWGPVPAFGITGAALASVVSYALAAITAFGLVQASALRLGWMRIGRDAWRQALAQIARVGGPAALASSVNPIGLSVLTAFVATFGADAVAGFGAAGRVQSFAVVPLLALSSSIGAIVGQNWGAERRDRAWKAVVYAGGFACAYGLATAAALFVFRRHLGALFSDDPGVIDGVARYIEVAAWGYAGYGVLITVNGALNAIDRAPISMAMSIARVVLVMVPAAYLGGLVAGGGPGWIYGGELAANLAGGTAAVVVAAVVMRPTPGHRAGRIEP